LRLRKKIYGFLSVPAKLEPVPFSCLLCQLNMPDRLLSQAMRLFEIRMGYVVTISDSSDEN
jgi:hypothetical protein